MQALSANCFIPRCSLFLLPAWPRFSLDKDTGLIMLIAKLDYELIQRFTLTVIARDGGGEETTGRVRVNVLDVNDNVPTFQKDAYVGALRENEPSVTQLVRLRVRCQAGLQSGRSCCPLSVPSSWRCPWEATVRAADLPSQRSLPGLGSRSWSVGAHRLISLVTKCSWCLPQLRCQVTIQQKAALVISLGKC